jgi:hypothetical protein
LHIVLTARTANCQNASQVLQVPSSFSHLLGATSHQKILNYSVRHCFSFVAHDLIMHDVFYYFC